MSEIAFIGDRDTIWPFVALGYSLFFAEEHESVSRLVMEVVEQRYKLIFVTEEVYEVAHDEIDEFDEQPIPTFTILPSVKGSRGTAMQRIRDSVRKAVGAELI